jgi:hypothetical protein
VANATTNATRDPAAAPSSPCLGSAQYPFLSQLLAPSSKLVFVVQREGLGAGWSFVLLYLGALAFSVTGTYVGTGLRRLGLRGSSSSSKVSAAKYVAQPEAGGETSDVVDNVDDVIGNKKEGAQPEKQRDGDGKQVDGLDGEFTPLTQPAESEPLHGRCDDDEPGADDSGLPSTTHSAQLNSEQDSIVGSETGIDEPMPEDPEKQVQTYQRVCDVGAALVCVCAFVLDCMTIYCLRSDADRQQQSNLAGGSLPSATEDGDDIIVSPLRALASSAVAALLCRLVLQVPCGLFVLWAYRSGMRGANRDDNRAAWAAQARLSEVKQSILARQVAMEEAERERLRQERDAAAAAVQQKADARANETVGQSWLRIGRERRQRRQLL